MGSQVSPQGGRCESYRPDKIQFGVMGSQVSPQGGRCESYRPDKTAQRHGGTELISLWRVSL